MATQEVIEKYSTRDLRALTDKEIEQELKWEKISFGTLFYKRDLDFCREKNINVTRILRLKLHEWLIQKFEMEE